MQFRAIFISLAMAASGFPLASENSALNVDIVDIAKRGNQILTFMGTANRANKSETPLPSDKRETTSIDIARRTNLIKALGYHV